MTVSGRRLKLDQTKDASLQLLGNASGSNLSLRPLGVARSIRRYESRHVGNVGTIRPPAGLILINAAQVAPADRFRRVERGFYQ